MKTKLSNLISGLIVAAMAVIAATAIISSTTGRLRAQERINWLQCEQALEMNQARADQGLPVKKIFVDVYTDWCGWCKRLDATTFANPEIIKYMNEHFIAVKLNAERQDTVVINGQAFVYVPGDGRRGVHQLAVVLLQNHMSYPSCTFLNENGQQLQVIPGYMDAKRFETVLHFFGEDAYKTQDWDTYSANFKGKVTE